MPEDGTLTKIKDQLKGAGLKDSLPAPSFYSGNKWRLIHDQAVLNYNKETFSDIGVNVQTMIGMNTTKKDQALPDILVNNDVVIVETKEEIKQAKPNTKDVQKETVEYWKKIYSDPGLPSNNELKEVELPKPNTVKCVLRAFEKKVNEEIGKHRTYHSVYSNPSSKILRYDSKEILDERYHSSQVIRSKNKRKTKLYKHQSAFGDDSSISRSDSGSDTSEISEAETAYVEDDLYYFEGDIQNRRKEETRPIEPEVMTRIRSCGSSVTFYGGEIIEKSTTPMFTQQIVEEIGSDIVKLTTPKIIASLPKYTPSLSPQPPVSPHKCDSVDSMEELSETMSISPDFEDEHGDVDEEESLSWVPLRKTDVLRSSGKPHSMVFDFRGKNVTPHIKDGSKEGIL